MKHFTIIRGLKCFTLFFAISSIIGCTSTNNPKPLSDSDKEAIDQLRSDIETVIMNGDAIAYADLCTDDIRTLHPGYPIIEGREDFIKHNAEIFEFADVRKLELIPLEIYGVGDLAYEVGTQVVVIEPSLEGFNSSRKYLHVMRRSEDGKWQFAALMSSDN